MTKEFLRSFFLKKGFIKIKKQYYLDPGVKPQDDEDEVGPEKPQDDELCFYVHFS